MTKFREPCPGPATIDTLPCLPAAFLARQGFLSNKQWRGLETRGLTILALSAEEGKIRIRWLLDEDSMLQDIVLGLFSNGALYKPYFLCPVTSLRCSCLYYRNGFWASRYAHGLRTSRNRKREAVSARMLALRDLLVGTASLRPLRGARRQKALEEVARELSRLEFVPNSWWDLEQVFDEEAMVQRLRTSSERRSVRDKTTSLRHAMGCGRSTYPGEVGAWTRPDAVVVSSEALLQARGVDPSIERLERHAYIDVATLRSGNLLVPGRPRGWVLAWPPQLTAGHDIFMLVDTTNPDAIALKLQLSRGDHCVIQDIRLRERVAMPGRLFLECPLLHTLHGRLYLRDGFFASAKAQQLAYRSQASHRSR